MSVDVTRLDMPVPDHAKTPAELLAAMRALRDWAALTYRELESRAQAAGDKLPRGTIASVLTRQGLPRESTIASFVRACVGDGDQVEVWLAARRRIAAANHTAENLADAVQAWLTKRSVPEPARALARVPSKVNDDDTGDTRRHYADGRLAQAAAQANGDRWIGLHRRVKPDGTLSLRRLTRKLARIGHLADLELPRLSRPRLIDS